ncbi:MAG: T9SS type A sorting domain-containing protein [Thermotogae bacterium]|nr:T9SS type A sorting domain-containing protein [Thermotogota bacterium]
MIVLLAYSVTFSKSELNALFTLSEGVGFPEVPAKIVVLPLENDELIVDVEVESVRRHPIDYELVFTQPIDTPNANLQMIQHLPQTYPTDIVKVGTQGFLRGKRIAFLVISAISIENGTTYLNEEVIFSIRKKKVENFPHDVPARSNLKIWRDVFASLNLNLPQDNYVPLTTFDYVIVTTEDLKDAWKPLAKLRNSMGIRTEIFTVEWIRENFPGNSVPEKIRNFLRYAYRTWGISYVLLGASAEEIPPLRTYVATFPDTISSFFGRYFHNIELTDFYYAALDGDWNPTGDAWEGDMEGGWDIYIDLIPDVAVGRYPAHTPEEVQSYVSKVYEYETSTNFSLPRYLFMGSNLWGDTVEPDSADGCLITYDLAARLGVGEVRYVCERPSTELRDSVTSFSPTLFFGVGHSNHRVIMTRNSMSAYDAYDYWRIEQSTPQNPSIATWIGCFINDPFDNSVALEMIRRGRAVASLGAAKADYSLSANNIWRAFFDTLGSKPYFPISGDVFYQAKLTLVSLAQTSPLYRHLIFTYQFIGDPLLRVFNNVRRSYVVSVSPSYDSLEFYVEDSLSSAPVPYVRVSVANDRLTLGHAYTGSDGRAKVSVGDGRNFWGVWHPVGLIKVGSLNVFLTGVRLRVDSATLLSSADTTTLRVWIRNEGSDTVWGLLPHMFSTDLYALNTPTPKNVPPGSITFYDWRVALSPYLSSPTVEVRVVGYALDDTFHLPVAFPRVRFISTSWHAHYDTLFLFLDVGNSGTVTAHDVRVVPDSGNFTILSLESYDSLPPGQTTNYDLEVRLIMPSLDNERVRFRLYASGSLQDTFSVVFRSTYPLPLIRSYWQEPGQGEVVLRWDYAFPGPYNLRWKVSSNGRTLNPQPLGGSFYSLPLEPLQKESVVVSPIIDGVEGPPLFSTVVAPTMALTNSRYLELIRFSSVPVFVSNSEVVMAQLLNYTREPEVVVATAYNRIFALTYDASRILWDVFTEGWIETKPVVADVDGDDSYEVIFATSFYLYALNGEDGSVLWRVPLPTFAGETDSIPRVRYLMVSKPFADSLPYLFAVSRLGSALLFNGRGELVAHRLGSVTDTFRVSPPATYDFDGDGNWEIIYKKQDSVWMFGGLLTPKDGFPIYIPYYTTGLFVADVDRDGEDEVVMCGHRNYVLKRDGSLILQDDNAYYPNYQCLPLDLNGNGVLDVAFYSPVYTTVSVWEIQDTGFVALLSEDLHLSTKAKFGISADVDGDGKVELLISDSRSRLHAYAYGWDRSDLPGFPIDLSDANGFRSSEIISPSAYEYNGKLYLYGPSEANILYVFESEGRAFWGSRFANRWATNSPIDSLPDEVEVSIAETKSPTGNLSISFKEGVLIVEGEGKLKVRLYSASGRLLKARSGIGKVTLKTLDLSAGVYLVLASDLRNRKVFKVIVR